MKTATATLSRQLRLPKGRNAPILLFAYIFIIHPCLEKGKSLDKFWHFILFFVILQPLL